MKHIKDLQRIKSAVDCVETYHSGRSNWLQVKN